MPFTVRGFQFAEESCSTLRALPTALRANLCKIWASPDSPAPCHPRPHRNLARLLAVRTVVSSPLQLSRIQSLPHRPSSGSSLESVLPQSTRCSPCPRLVAASSELRRHESRDADDFLLAGMWCQHLARRVGRVEDGAVSGSATAARNSCFSTSASV